MHRRLHGRHLQRVEDLWQQGRRTDGSCALQNFSKAEVLELFGAVVGVKDVSITVVAGEVFCITGLSGSGKSTLVQYTNRLIEPTGGEILINSVDVGGLNPEERRALWAD